MYAEYLNFDPGVEVSASSDRPFSIIMTAQEDFFPSRDVNWRDMATLSPETAAYVSISQNKTPTRWMSRAKSSTHGPEIAQKGGGLVYASCQLQRVQKQKRDNARPLWGALNIATLNSRPM